MVIINSKERERSDYRKTSLGLLPKDWEVLKAGEIFSNHSNKDHNGDLEVLSATQDRGIVPRSQLDIDIKFERGSLVNYKKVEPGDFVISLRSFQGGIEYSEYEGLVSPAYTVLKNKVEIHDGFYKYLFKKEDFINRLNSLIYGIRDGKQISYRDFKDLKIQYPPIKQQQKIASILSTWDKAIELKEKLIEQKKEQKKGLMQKLLTGEVRLPGFSGEWKEVKLEKISVCLDNFRKPLNSKERERMKGNIPYYGANGIIDYVNDYLFNEPLILLAEDGGHFNEFREKAIAIKLEGKSWVNNHAHVLRIINSDINFVFYSMVHKDIRKYINGSTRGKLTRADMLKIELLLPNNIKEQKAIADILMKIDHNIELLEKELEQLKQQKKGLMQQLLTGKIRVKV